VDLHSNQFLAGNYLIDEQAAQSRMILQTMMSFLISQPRLSDRYFPEDNLYLL
jgi:hypothetical protein